MTRKEYTDAVLAVLRHVTRREREAIRREIDGHIEDHMEDLLELDYPPELAEERTLSAMGDPGEVGRALNRQYPFRWLVAARTAMALTIAAVLLMGSGLLGFLSNTGDNLRARFCPETLVAVEYHSDHLDAVKELDLRAELEDVTVRVYQAGLTNASGGGMAYVALSCWNDNPFVEPPELINTFGWEEVLRITGSSCGLPPSGGTGSKWTFVYEVPVNYGDTVEITYERWGRSFRLSVPLPWEEDAA